MGVITIYASVFCPSRGAQLGPVFTGGDFGITAPYADGIPDHLGRLR
jgi:hypothetical protein